jgi:6-pyruvoyltetrahydropterin/6-carboxytetrahydropterin synthase
MERWSIHLHKEDFKFSAAHFLIFPDGSKERLHGHNYRVAVEIEGPVGGEGIVLDFKQVKPDIRSLCAELDEYWLVPGEHPEVKVDQRDDGHTEVVYRACRYLAPTDEVVVLPISNTSSELFAAWMARELDRRLSERFGAGSIARLRVSIEETAGQHGAFEIDRTGD